jgi:ribosomal protein S12 methylthiotransferase
MNKVKIVSIVSLGCAKNLVDSEILLGGLKKANFNISNNPSKADIVIINTCGFLDSAREESVDVILDTVKLKKNGEIEMLVVMGCFSERYGTQLRAELPEVDQFFGTNDHAKIVSFLTGKPHSKDDPEFFRSILTPDHYAYLKIAEGCDNGCSFCSIPLMRGMQKSKSIDWCVGEANRLVQGGVKEILVIAQDSTSYGWDLSPRRKLHDLMKALDKVEKLNWLRLHYAHPAHLQKEMIAQFGYLEKLVPYIDIPIQHSSDKLLKIMRRGLSFDGIRKRLDSLKMVNPDIAIRTSVIVGHPGETEEEFQHLYNFINEFEFDRLGVFTYSEEEDTHSASMKNNIPEQTKIDRMDAIMMLQQDINLMKNQNLVGSIESVLVDKNTNDGNSIARTYRDSPDVDNIVVVNGVHKMGDFIDVKFTNATDYELTAEKV